MKGLTPAALQHLARLRETARVPAPPPDIARALVACGACTLDGKGGLRITGKGREGLRSIEMARSVRKTYV